MTAATHAAAMVVTIVDGRIKSIDRQEVSVHDAADRGRMSSINVRKVLWTCAEVDLPFERVGFGLGTARTQSQRPGSGDSGRRVRHVGVERNLPLSRRQAAARGIIAGRSRGACAVEQWMDWQATELNSSWRYAFSRLARKQPSPHRRSRDRQRASSTGTSHMRHARCALRAWRAIHHRRVLHAADVVLGLSTHRWLHTPIDRPPLDAVQGYYQRLSVRPAFRAHVSAEVPCAPGPRMMVAALIRIAGLSMSFRRRRTAATPGRSPLGPSHRAGRPAVITAMQNATIRLTRGGIDRLAGLGGLQFEPQSRRRVLGGSCASSPRRSAVEFAFALGVAGARWFQLRCTCCWRCGTGFASRSSVLAVATACLGVAWRSTSVGTPVRY